MDLVYRLIKRDPAVCVFVTGAARRVEERQEAKLRGQELLGDLHSYVAEQIYRSFLVT